MFCLMSFGYNVDEVLEELNSRLFQLVYGKIGFIIYTVSFKVTEPTDDVKWGLSVFMYT